MEFEESEQEYVTWLREMGYDDEYIERAVFDARILQEMEDELKREMTNG